MSIDKSILEKVNSWLDGGYDSQTKEAIKELLRDNPNEITESFYKNLEFGTGGLRGIMGVGSNRMNVYTVGMATQGLANFIISHFKGQELRVAVAYDNRNNNTIFANTVANIFAANGFKVYLFSDIRPTPELSFAIRELKCLSGVMITASHNPKEYNGYKAYWCDGGQVVEPNDKNIIKEVDKISSISQVKWDGNKENIIMLGEEMDNKYLSYVKSLSLSPESVKRHSDLKIVYTPIHGTGVKIMPEALKAYGFNNVIMVKEQCVIDGNFPTVIHPNPEDPAAMKMAIDLANKVNADIVMASDPDADRLAIGIRDDKKELILLNGNQTAAILTYYLLKRWSDNKKLTGKEFIVKTIVTSNLISDIADSFDVEYYNVLTGFKWIADVIRKNEGIKKYIGGGEESYGYMIGDAVRDKDSISAGAMISETMAWAMDNGSSLYGMLLDIYIKYGLYQEDLVTISKYGISGAKEIADMMTKYRNNPHSMLGGSKVIYIYDYKNSTKRNTETGEVTKIELPVSDVLQYETADKTLVSMRPSGTEPKIKFYFSVREELHNRKDYKEMLKRAHSKIEQIKKEFGV
ncbi:MAG: phospho-sugar mutase [Rikenellaceae bacterium]